MVPDGEDADLIRALIEGMVEQPLWSTFTAKLRARMRADYASIVFRPLPDSASHYRGIVHLASGRQWPPIIAALYRENFYKSDPLPYYALEPGRVYALPELLDVSDPEHELYRRQTLEPSGMNMLCTMRVVEPGGVSAWLTVSRQKGDFSAEEKALLASLAPYLGAVLHSYSSIERDQTAALVAQEAVSRMNFGWLTLDEEGRVLDTDMHGARMLADSGLLVKGRSGRLTASSREVAAEICGAIKALTTDPQGRPRAVVLSREPWLDMLLVSASMRAGTAQPAPTIIAYVHADNWSSADRCDQLCELFDLIPSEARLALALSRGMSIADAAGEIGITVESARTYSKRIYAKTGARGQADLVRFIHRSVLAIA